MAGAGTTVSMFYVSKNQEAESFNLLLSSGIRKNEAAAP